MLALKFCMQHWVLEDYQDYSDDDRVDLDLFMARSNMEKNATT